MLQGRAPDAQPLLQRQHGRTSPQFTQEESKREQVSPQTGKHLCNLREDTIYLGAAGGQASEVCLPPMYLRGSNLCTITRHRAANTIPTAPLPLTPFFLQLHFVSLFGVPYKLKISISKLVDSADTSHLCVKCTSQVFQMLRQPAVSSNSN